MAASGIAPSTTRPSKTNHRRQRRTAAGLVLDVAQLPEFGRSWQRDVSTCLDPLGSPFPAPLSRAWGSRYWSRCGGKSVPISVATCRSCPSMSASWPTEVRTTSASASNAPFGALRRASSFWRASMSHESPAAFRSVTRLGSRPPRMSGRRRSGLPYQDAPARTRLGDNTTNFTGHLRRQRAELQDQQLFHHPHHGLHLAVRSHSNHECDPQCEAGERERHRARLRRALSGRNLGLLRRMA